MRVTEFSSANVKVQEMVDLMMSEAADGVCPIFRALRELRAPRRRWLRRTMPAVAKMSARRLASKENGAVLDFFDAVICKNFVEPCRDAWTIAQNLQIRPSMKITAMGELLR